MTMRARLLGAALALGALGLGAGCNPELANENAQLKEINAEYEMEVVDLRRQLDALRNQPLPTVPEDPRVRTLQIEVDKLNEQLGTYQRMVNLLKGRVRLAEKLEDQLRDLAERFGGEYDNNRLALPGDYFFDSGQWKVSSQGREALRRFFEVMRNNGLADSMTIMITGHTDSDPVRHARKRGVRDNRHLSVLRSLAVLEELKDMGYPAEKMYPTGWGDLRPQAANDSSAGKARNRRVEIYIDPAASGAMNVSAITEVTPVPTPGARPEVLAPQGPITITE